ncbi:MAG: tetratricopeptide repeat protein [Armatimonadetes bacterium]|nr:tetratricopeptide repeat protein [Armatimonadota bacterium]
MGSEKHFSLSGSMLEGGDEALRQLEGALQRFPENPSIYLWKAKTLLDLERIPEANEALHESLARSPENILARGLQAQIHIKEGRVQEARRLLERYGIPENTAFQGSFLAEIERNVKDSEESSGV